MLRAGSVSALAHRHADIEEELVVAADEGERRGKLRAAGRGARQRRRELAQQQARAGDIALVHLVAHGEAARDQRLERDAAGLAQRAAERRAEHVPEPAQPVQHLGVVAAEPHHLAEALVDGAVGAVSERPVLHHHHGLACAWSCRSSGRRRRNGGWDGTRMHRPPPAGRRLRGPWPSLRTPRSPSRRPASGRTCAPTTTGGPAWRITRSASSGMTAAAGTTSTSTGSPASMRRNVSWLASSMIFNGLPQRARSTSQLAEEAREVRIAAGRRGSIARERPAGQRGDRFEPHARSAPLPLVGRGRGWGSGDGAHAHHNLPTPHPDPPPQGGREKKNDPQDRRQTAPGPR